MVDPQEQAARGHLVAVQRLRDGSDAAAGDAGFLPAREPVRGTARADDGRQAVPERRTVRHAIRVGPEARVLRELRPADRAAERAPERLAADAHDDGAV